MAALPAFIQCVRCAQAVKRKDWPRDAGGHLKPRCSPCMSKYRELKPRKRISPEQKAEWARKKLGVSVAYVPQSVRNELARERRLPRYDAHVKAQARHLSKLARCNARGLLHDAHVQARKHSALIFRIRYRTDPEFAIRQRLRTQLRKKAKLYPKLDTLMRDAIKRRGSSKTVEVVCGFTISDLVKHLESRFTDSMNWNAFMLGEIHIDHVVPQARFDLKDHDAVRRCWALTNLQPLWASDNMAKGSRLDWPPVQQAA